jgi:predicted lipoprotein with Yx(FWY)xxD motif
MRRSLLLVAGLAVLGLVASGCGDDDETGTVAQEGTTTTADDGGGATDDEAEDDSAATVTLVDSDLGEILADAEGRTVYLFTRDSDGTSACTGDCLTAWPPLEASGPPVAGDGVDDSKLGTITRDDGTEQVTYASMPLYYFAGDSAAGDVNGQGVNDVWWVVDADGEAVMDEPATEDSGSGSGGY